MAFAVEEIPDADDLYRSISGGLSADDRWSFEIGRPHSGAFVPDPDGVSMDWARYRAPRARLKSTTLAVVAITAGRCRSFGARVVHAPVQEGEPYGPNQAHALVQNPAGLPRSDQKLLRARIAEEARIVVPPGWQDETDTARVA